MKTKTLHSLVVLLIAACVAHPEGERDERARALEAGREFDAHLDPPPLPENPRLEDYLRVAFLANAELRTRYWEWRAALERIPQEGSPPNAALSFAYLFSDENLSAWDRTTLGLTSDPMTNVPFPGKLALAARRALEEARAAGQRFEAAKFGLQARVLSLYYDLALHAEQIRIQAAVLELATLAEGEASARLAAASGTEAEFLRAQGELEYARNAQANLHAELPPMRAQMNALLGRAADAPLAPSDAWPAAKPLPATDAELLSFAAERSPELAALAHEVAGREEGLELARKARLPDVNLSFSFTGAVSEVLGAMVVLPTRRAAIAAGIEQARAELERAKAARVQYARDLAASFVLDLYVLRNAERQELLFRDTLLPRAELLVRANEAALATGRGALRDVIEARLTALDARLVLAMLRVEREKALAAIETWSALDVETLHPARAGPEGMR